MQRRHLVTVQRDDRKRRDVAENIIIFVINRGWGVHLCCQDKMIIQTQSLNLKETSAHDCPSFHWLEHPSVID